MQRRAGNHKIKTDAWRIHHFFFAPKGIKSTVVVQHRILSRVFGILGSRCLTGSALLDCHVLEGFGIYMIGILDSLSGVWKSITGIHRVTSICNLSSII